MAPGPDPSDGNDPLVARLDEVRASWGIDFPAAEAVLRVLARGGTMTVSLLVEAGRMPRRRVLGILRALEPWVTEGDGGLDLDPVAADRIVAWLGPERTPSAGDGDGDHWDRLARSRPDLVDRLTGFAAGLPPSRWSLDHVPTTPHTMAKRALYLAETFALAGARLLCVGDHDLTALAVAATEPEVRVAVVDVDERLLGYIDAVARREGLPVVTARGDLRLGLPPSLSEWAHLAFTDPPYTPAGVGLFLRRALEGLDRSRPARALFCYGFGDRGAARALDVQAVVGDLRLALDAVHPQFNAYTGAESIGARSHLYVCRPTRTTWAALKSRPPSEAFIYTRGPAAENGVAPEIPAPVADSVAQAVAEVGAIDGKGRLVVVGPGWPDPFAGDPGRAGRRVALDGYLTHPPAAADAAAVNLHPHLGSVLLDVLLVAPRTVVVVVSGRAWRTSGLARASDPVRVLFDSAFEFQVASRGGDADPTVVVARRRSEEPAGPFTGLHRYLLGHAGAKAVNAWREGLVHVAAAAGVPLSKNEARAAIAATGPGPSLTELSLGELSLESLRELAERSRDSVTAILPGVAADW